jgi:CHAT domain-containing protein
MSGLTHSYQFADLEIHILPRRNEGYPVQITLDGQQDFPRGYLSTDILNWHSNGDSDQDGRYLFKTLFADNVLSNAWATARGRALQRRIRLWIDVEAAELHALPWELLQQEQVPLSAQADTPFSRYLPVDLPWSDPIKERPIRVLVVISNPDDLESRHNLARLDVELEQKSLQKAFAAMEPDQLQPEFLEAPVTPKRLQSELRNGYHVLHFVGHGVFDTRRKQAALYMQDMAGNAQPFIDHQLVGMLAGQAVKPRMVFLAACQSATRSTADAFLGLGPRLVAGGVPAIVAMQDAVSFETAREFSATFYQLLLRHGLVDLAVNEARNTLLVVGRPDAGVPVLFMRLQDGALFAPSSPVHPSPSPPATYELQLVLESYMDTKGQLYHPYQIKLNQLLTKYFKDDELRGLCDELGTDYDDFRGGRRNKIRELVSYFARYGRGRELIETIYRQRPNISWFDQNDIIPTKLRQIMLETYDERGMRRLCQNLITAYGSAYDVHIGYDYLTGNTRQEKVQYLIDWHLHKSFGHDVDGLIAQVRQDIPKLLKQITFGTGA